MGRSSKEDSRFCAVNDWIGKRNCIVEDSAWQRTVALKRENDTRVKIVFIFTFVQTMSCLTTTTILCGRATGLVPELPA